jgi:uncharacterized protein (TIGR02466 family)
MSTKAEVHAIFPEVLCKAHIKLDNKSLLKAIKELTFIRDNAQPKNTGTSTSRYLFQEPVFHELQKKALVEFGKFHREILQYTHDYAVTTSWATETKPGEQSKLHKHINCQYSGVYYVSVPQGSNTISFAQHEKGGIMTIPYRYNSFNSKRAIYTLKEGDLIFFPSHMWHQIDLNKSKKTRYSIAFNLIPTGVIGEGDSQLILNV